MADEHADFWREWWKRDYSWEGLAALNEDGTPKHPWEGWIVVDDGTERVRLEEDPEPERYSKYKDKKIPVPDNARLATLQDYWRDQENHLIPDETSKNEKGEVTRHFTRFHLPLHWPAGTPTGKAEWNEAEQSSLNVLIGEKVEKSAETELDFRYNIKGTDQRVQFQGGVFPDFDVNDFKNLPAEPDAEPEQIQLNWRSDFAFFSGDAWFESATFSGVAQFERATFCGYAWFNSATFTRNATFTSATFSGDARFDSATFSGDAWFNSTTFSRDPRFSNATFSGDAWFNSATFCGYAWFHSAAFSRNADFESAIFSEDAYFESATFPGYAGFESATFSGNAWFASATFSRYARFVSAIFSRNASFGSATFSGNAGFNSAIFAGSVSFQGDGASFTVEPFELRSEGGGAADQNDAGVEINFSENLVRTSGFNDLAKRAFKDASFEDCVFLGTVNFNNRDFTEATSFRRSEFWRLASFHGSRLHQGVSFYNAIFRYAIHRDRQRVRCGPKLGGRDWPQVREDVKKRLYEAVKKAGKTEADFEDWEMGFEEDRTHWAEVFQRLPKSKYDARENEGFWSKRRSQFQNLLRLKKHKPKPVEGKTQEDYFEKLEACYRTLKLAMEDKRDRVEEGKFFSLEIKTRRRRRRPNVPFWERLMSDLYGGTSDYGNSVVRPVVWIVWFMLVFGLVYAVQGSSSFWGWDWKVPNFSELGQAFSYSAGRVFGFGPWGSEPEACTMMGQLLNVQPDAGVTCDDGHNGWGVWTAFGIKAQATVQTLMAIILVFLSGLAVRRRFQIN